MGVYRFVSLPLSDSSILLRLSHYMLRSGRNRFASCVCYISALATLSHFLGLTLSRHGAFRLQIIGHRTYSLSVSFSLSLDGDCSVAVSGALPDCLHASTIPCCCSKCGITFFLPPSSLSLRLSRGCVPFVCLCLSNLSVGWTAITPSRQTRNAEHHPRVLLGLAAAEKYCIAGFR